MDDFLLKLKKKSLAGKIVSSIGLPIPEKLRRAKTPWQDYPLKGRDVVVGGTGELHPQIAKTQIGRASCRERV